MHKRNRLYVTIGLIYGLLGGLLMWVSFAIFTARVWPVLWPSARTSGRATIPLVPAE
jgi:hypothetical protein